MTLTRRAIRDGPRRDGFGYCRAAFGARPIVSALFARPVGVHRRLPGGGRPVCRAEPATLPRPAGSARLPVRRRRTPRRVRFGQRVVTVGPRDRLDNRRVLRRPALSTQGLGTDAARSVFAKLPGAWEIGVLDSNAPAIRFWRQVVSWPHCTSGIARLISAFPRGPEGDGHDRVLEQFPMRSIHLRSYRRPAHRVTIALNALS